MIRYLKAGYAIVFVIAFALMTAGCDSNLQRNEEEFKAASEHLMTVWSDYLRLTEQMYSSETWALDYVDAYLESGDWTDLSMARTACITSEKYIKELSMTEEDLDEKEYGILAEAGVDTTYQSSEFAGVPETLKSGRRAIGENILEPLEADIFYKSANDNLKKMVSIQRETITAMSRYTCAMTNYLLVSIGDEEMSESYWESMQENYPVICKGRAEWLDNETDIKKAASGYLDDYEETLSKFSDLIAAKNSELYNMTEIIQNNDMEALIADACHMVNLPEMIQMPVWYAPESAVYINYVIKEDGSTAYPESGDELKDLSYKVYVQIDGVTLEEVEEYIQHIDGTVGDIVKSSETDMWLITMKDYQVVIQSKEGKVQIIFEGEDVTFAPGWYIGL
ncbi:MAG: hypothetical protein K2K09_05735 [Lachnospiraceae bacterium]|nr:hypothetical protein [Lachnospiraceae bacterium]